MRVSAGRARGVSEESGGRVRRVTVSGGRVRRVTVSGGRVRRVTVSDGRVRRVTVSGHTGMQSNV